MDREFYLGLARSGLRMPVGTDLLLDEDPDPDRTRRDGRRLGRIVEAAARRYRTPLAFPLMDLRLEKAALLGAIGVPETQVDTFHFHEPPGDDVMEAVAGAEAATFPAANQAQFDAIRYIARETSLVPVGMSIGPFSLMTKLMKDPIAAVAMAGAGVGPDESAEVLSAYRCLALAERTLARSVAAQIEAGARAIIFCEPAASTAYISPRQMAAGSGVFEKFVMEPNLRIKRQLEQAGVDLIFHDCGQLTGEMVRQYAGRLDPVILSLGSSRVLWEDAGLVPKHIVLYGNLPTKSFYSDALMSLERVEQLTRELIRKMRAVGHPHILGSECDVLAVPGAAGAIRRKVDVMLNCPAG